MKKILIFSQYYYPIENAWAKRVINIVNSLKDNYNIKIITWMPNYPLGKFYKWYKCFYKKDENIEYIWEYPTKNEWFFWRLFNYISYCFLAFFLSFKHRNINYVYATPPSVFISILWFLTAKIKWAKLIIDVRDLWPESIAALWFISKKNIIYKLLLSISHYIYNKSDILITNSEWIQKTLERITNKKVYLIKNCISEKIYRKKTAKPKEFENKFLLTYTWNHSEAQNLEQIIYLAKKLKKIENWKLNENWKLKIENYKQEHSSVIPNYNKKPFYFILVWDWESKQKLIKLSKDLKLNNVSFKPYSSTEEINNILNYSDIWIISLKNDKTFHEVMPSKIYEYLKIWLPIIWFWDWTIKKFINENNIWQCWFCHSEQSKEFILANSNKYLQKHIDAIYKLKNNKKYYQKISNNCINLAEKEFSFTVFKSKILNTIS